MAEIRIKSVWHLLRRESHKEGIEVKKKGLWFGFTVLLLVLLWPVSAVLADGLQPPENISLRTSSTDPSNHTLVWSPVDGAALVG